MKQLSVFNKLITATLIFTVLVCATTTAMAGQRASIVRSWKLVDDQTGDIFFGTYNGNRFRGTVNLTSPDNSISLTHGAWKRTGPRTFADTHSGFIYDANGIANLIITFRAEIEVNLGGDTASFDFEFEVTQFDGTLVDSGTSTATAARVKVEPV